MSHSPPENEDKSTVLNRAVRALRKRLKMTQAEFATHIGKHMTTVVRYEGPRPPSGTILVVLANEARNSRLDILAALFEFAFRFEREHPHATPAEIEKELWVTLIHAGIGPFPPITGAEIIELIEDWLSRDYIPVQYRDPATVLSPLQRKYFRALLNVLKMPEHNSTRQHVVGILDATLAPFFDPVDTVELEKADK